MPWLGISFKPYPTELSSESALGVASMDGGKGRELGAVSLIVFWRDQSCLQNNALIVNQLEGHRSFRLWLINGDASSRSHCLRKLHLGMLDNLSSAIVQALNLQSTLLLFLRQCQTKRDQKMPRRPICWCRWCPEPRLKIACVYDSRGIVR